MCNRMKYVTGALASLFRIGINNVVETNGME